MLSIFSTVFERIVQDQLCKFLNANGILINNQYAFRALYSTITSLVNSNDHWRQNTDNQKLNMTIFLDLKQKHLILRHAGEGAEDSKCPSCPSLRGSKSAFFKSARQPNYKHYNVCKIRLYQISKVQDLRTLCPKWLNVGNLTHFD